jgi:uncharacterized protein (DUF924 family)
VSARSAQEILSYWFGPEPLATHNLPGRLQLWFGNDDPPYLVFERDQALQQRFGAQIEAAAQGDLDHWSSSPHRLLALILLLDTFPRHVYRGRALAYSRDHKALALVLEGMHTGADAALSVIERLFFYMPLQHAESAAVQEESLSACQRLVVDAPPAHRGLFEDCLEFARQHQQIVQRFGRFPHRNAVLSRRSSAEELAYLSAGQGQP